MTFSLTLSVRDVHFKLVPTLSAETNQSPSSCFGAETSSSPIVSVSLQPTNRNHNGTDDVNATANNSSNSTIDNCEEDEEDFEIVADLSQFSGTLRISSIGGGIQKNALSKKKTAPQPEEETGADVPSPLFSTRKVTDLFPQFKKSERIPSVGIELQLKTKEDLSEKNNCELDFVNEIESYETNWMDDNDKSNLRVDFDDNSLGSDETKQAIVAIRRRSSGIIREKTGRRFASPYLQMNLFLSNLSTELHMACASHDTPMMALLSILERNPKLAASRDALGDMPIHIFARNEMLALSEELEHAETFVYEYLKIVPDFMTVPSSDDGLIPFASAIVTWIEQSYSNRDETISKNSELNILGTSTQNYNFAPSPLPTEEQCLIFLYPINLSMKPIVLWSLQILSFVLDELHTMRTLHRRRKTSARILNETRKHIIDEISSLPLFCKTILSLDSTEELHNLLPLTIITNTFLHENSIGPWLIGMFYGDKFSRTRAVEFLELVSSWGVDDLVGGHRRWFRIDHDAFVQNRTRTFKAFANLPENITATRVIGKKPLERATATHIVQYALNCRIGEPLVLGVMVFDGLFHIILLFAYRFAVLEKDAQKSGISPSALLVYLPAVYFIGRDVLTLASIILSSKQILSLYLRNPWTYMDIMSVVMAAWTTSDQSESQQIFGRSIAIAITIALLWFKLLGFLRYINKQLTTFIASFFEILGAIKWFFLVLMVAIMLFGDTIETILKFNNTCSEEDFEDSTSGAQADFCSPQPMESYLRIYSVVIGDVSLDDFQQTTFMKSLFFFFTFFGIIVLLNILIAIVNDSYSRAIMRSNGLFGKARMELVVRQLAREYFTVPKFVDEESQHLCSIWTIRKIFGFFLKFTVMSIIVSVEVCLIIFTSSFVNNFVEGVS